MFAFWRPVFAGWGLGGRRPARARGPGSHIKTLVIAADPVYPAVSGADLRNWQHAAAAAALGPVMLATAGRPLAAPPGIETRHLDKIDYAKLFASDFDVAFSRQAIIQFQTVQRDFAPDIIVFESLVFANLMRAGRRSPAALILDLHNIESHLVGQEASRQQDPKARRTIAARAQKIRQIERRALALADAAWVCSAADRELLATDGADFSHIRVIPNGIPNIETLPPAPPVRANPWPPRLIFAGHLGYAPNVEAALALGAIIALLRERGCAARLILAGRNPHPAVSALAAPGWIEVAANPGPADLAKFLAGAHLAVMPLQRGGGTRLKALEAAAWGLPIVATAKAVEGLGLRDKVHVCLAETPAAFATAIFDLARDPAAMAAQSCAARAYVMAAYAPQVLHAATREALLAAFIAPSHGRVHPQSVADPLG